MRPLILAISATVVLTAWFTSSLAAATNLGEQPPNSVPSPPPAGMSVTIRETVYQGGQGSGGGAHPAQPPRDSAGPSAGGNGGSGPGPAFPMPHPEATVYYDGRMPPRGSGTFIAETGRPAEPDAVSAAPAPAPAPPVAGVDPIVLVRQAIVGLQVPAPTPHIGPEPAWNEWNAAAVNFPYWLWTDRVEEPSLNQIVLGQNVRLVAHWDSVSFDMGDGHSIDCADTSIYVRGQVKPAAPSPLCGYRYRDKGTYTITATHHWLVDWTVGTNSGQVHMDRSTAMAPITVAEFESVVTG